MKKFQIAITIICLMLCTAAFSSCGQAASTSSNESALKSEIEQLKQQVSSQAQLISTLLANKENVQNQESNNPQNESTDKNETQNNNPASYDFEYIKEGNGITVTKYTGSQTSVRIPETIEGLPVLNIGKNAFADTEIKSVTIPSLCEYVDWFAFYGCYGLTTVYISENVSEIGYAAFEGCSKKLTIYCPSNSYAEKYAKSFGIAFSIIS